MPVDRSAPEWVPVFMDFGIITALLLTWIRLVPIRMSQRRETDDDAESDTLDEIIERYAQ